MPLRYLFEPWKAPLAIQEKAGCLIGKDYPAPIVEHRAAASSNREKMNKTAASLDDKCKWSRVCCISALSTQKAQTITLFINTHEQAAFGGLSIVRLLVPDGDWATQMIDSDHAQTIHNLKIDYNGIMISAVLLFSFEKMCNVY